MDENFSFPEGFIIGSASSSYQIEGGWNENGKGESIWDKYVHLHPEYVVDGTNGDISCDSYHKYKDDVKILKQMGVQFYRFSICWPRVLPTGDIGIINQPGIDYYNNLITELLNNDIEPMVTIYHWELPQALQDLGGWVNPIIANYFEDYARILFTQYGDKVKWWITFNEPGHICQGYADGPKFAPGLSFSGVGDYLAGHTILQAHAKVYHLYDKEFRQKHKGKIGISLCGNWFEPKSDTENDRGASEMALQFELGWFAHPIFSMEGDYPSVMKERVSHNSKAEGRTRSRLPLFDTEWITNIRGTADFFGMNHYTTYLVTKAIPEDRLLMSRYSDSGVIKSRDPTWPTGKPSWLKVVPWGLRKMLNWIKTEYSNPPVFITENGYGDSGELEDAGRINYLVDYMSEMLLAVNVNGCKVFGYTAWSLMDNYEWITGYTEKFGLYQVDFNDPERPRTPKKSSLVLTEIIKQKKIPAKFLNKSLQH